LTPWYLRSRCGSHLSFCISWRSEESRPRTSRTPSESSYG
jgi:hypothetical protein